MKLRIGLAFLLALSLCGLAAAAPTPAGVPQLTAAPLACSTPTPALSGAAGLTPAPAPQASQKIFDPSVFQTTCSGCQVGTQCRRLHSCVLQGCC